MIQLQLSSLFATGLLCLLAAPLPAQVAAIAPETIPAWVRHDTSLVTDARASGFKFTRNVVLVRFKLDATPEERTTAVRRVGGTVIGGNRFNVGSVYVIQLAADDTNDRLFDAVRSLNADSMVSAADLFRFMRGTRPSMSIVPAFAPDESPRWISDDSSLVRGSPLGPGFIFSKDILMVTFKPLSTQRERSAAVARVAGTVIGGARLNDVDGFYIIRLPADSTHNRLSEALRILESDPAVATAFYHWFMINAIGLISVPANVFWQDTPREDNYTQGFYFF